MVSGLKKSSSKQNGKGNIHGFVVADTAINRNLPLHLHKKNNKIPVQGFVSFFGKILLPNTELYSSELNA